MFAYLTFNLLLDFSTDIIAVKFWLQDRKCISD